MNLGWCDVCLRVASAAASRRFYQDLGFVRVEGSDEEGWAVITNGDVRLGLFEPQFMADDTVTLNFRGGVVLEACRRLTLAGHRFESGPKSTARGASATLRDPDGYAIFLDAAVGECKPVAEIP